MPVKIAGSVESPDCAELTVHRFLAQEMTDWNPQSTCISSELAPLCVSYLSGSRIHCTSCCWRTFAFLRLCLFLCVFVRANVCGGSFVCETPQLCTGSPDGDEKVLPSVRDPVSYFDKALLFSITLSQTPLHSVCAGSSFPFSSRRKRICCGHINRNIQCNIQYNYSFSSICYASLQSGP